MSEDTDKVVYFPGPTRLDIPAERVIDGAREAGLTDIVIAGYTADGQEYFASSYAGGPDALWLMERFRHELLNAVQELAEDDPA